MSIKVTVNEPTEQEKRDRIFSINVAMDEASDIVEAAQRVIQTYIRAELYTKDPDPLGAVESALSDLYELGVISGEDEEPKQ